jgi:hypothetical protein
MILTIIHNIFNLRPRFIEVPMPSQERDRSFICVLGVLILPPFAIFLLDFGIDPTVWYFCILALPVMVPWSKQWSY